MRFTIQRPDLGETLAGTENDIARAITSAMHDVSAGLNSDLRADVVSAGLGERLSRTWRGTTYPETKVSMEAAAFVWSKAPKIIDAFSRGVVIRSPRGLYLAIPTMAAGSVGRSVAGKREKITPQGWERRTGMKLRFVYRPGRPSLLVADGTRLSKKGLAARNRRKSGDATSVIFILVPQVRLAKRLDIERAAQKHAGRVTGLIAQHWDQA